MSDLPASPRILVVDDDADLLATVTQGLRLLGHFDVAVADQGAAGLETFLSTLQSDSFSCIVADIRMPGLNGYQLIRAIRGDPATAQTPIVVLSALVQDEDEFAGLLSGADAYLRKPVEIRTLITTITQAIALSVEQRQQRERDLAEGHFS